MTIKEASKKTGISIDNLRYYERIGLIPEVPRTESGIREYDEMSISWIEFAMKFVLQYLGFFFFVLRNLIFNKLTKSF